MASIVFFLPFLTVLLDATSTTQLIKPNPGSEDSAVKLDETLVRIFNRLGGNDGNPSVTVHCKSKDDDLGTHVLHNGGCFGWKFQPNFWRTTLFYCHISWTGGAGTYDLYQAKRDIHRCLHNCTWYVIKDGIIRYKIGDNNEELAEQDLFFKWK